jgi:hypothetical protein
MIGAVLLGDNRQGRGGTVAGHVELRTISHHEGNRLLRIGRRDSGSVVTWRRAQMVLLAAQRIPAPRIAEVTFTSEDRVRDVIHNFNHDGFDSLYPATGVAGHPPSPSPGASRSRSSRSADRRTTTCRSRPGRWQARGLLDR